MPDSVPRRRLLARLGAVCSLPLTGCSGWGDTRAGGPIEERETTPVRAQGDSITVTRSVSSTNATVVENGSVDPGDGTGVKPFSAWASSRSVHLAETALRDGLTERIDDYQESSVEWNLRWEDSNSRFLIATTALIEPPADNVAWPSGSYNALESSAPSTVTVTIRTSERTVSNEYQVYTRAKLRSPSGSSRQP